MPRKFNWARRATRISISFVVIVALTAVALIGPERRAGAAAFSVGDNLVVVMDRLNIRAAAGTDSAVVRVLEGGTVLTVLSGPADADGYTWYQVNDYFTLTYPDQEVGWVAADFVVQVVDAESEGASLVDGFVNTDVLNLRSGPGLSYAAVKQYKQGDGLMLGEPTILSDGYTWYSVQLPGRPNPGWVAGEFISLDGTGSVADFNAGDDVAVATDFLNLRDGFSLSSTVLDVLPNATSLSILNGPNTVDGYDWYLVVTSDGASGWVAGTYLTLVTESSFSVGDTIHVIGGALNLRAESGLSADVLRVVEDDEEFFILEGPIAADGYQWYRIENVAGEGWAAGEFLQLNPG